MKKERLTTSDEQRERMLIAEQIERAQAEAGPSDTSESPPPEEAELKRDEGEKVVLSFAPKTTVTPSAAPSVGFKLNPLKPATNPLKAGANPLKRPNVFKQASTAASAPAESEKKTSGPMSAAERLMFEDQERKRRKMEREAGAPLMA